MSAEREIVEFCEEFVAAERGARYVLGRNVYAASVMSCVKLNGIIDDFTDETEFLGLPIVRTTEVPKDALVLNAAGGRPLTARRTLTRLGLRNIDYFAFYRYSGLPLRGVVFNEGFAEDYVRRRKEYDWVLGLLADEESRRVFSKLVAFRSTLDMAHLEGFSARESAQYFEDFLDLSRDGEVFVDVGCYDGSNSLEFIRRVPGYQAVHALEPDPENFARCRQALSGYRDVSVHNLALGATRGTLGLTPGGSGSRISPSGPIQVQVGILDEVLDRQPTFVKMDIEGGECEALCGARRTIERFHPRLAICVYHKVGDFYRVPRLVLDMREDYDVFLRHYTESIYETVMFFIPRGARA
jgi:FkbM family methyltransferase